MTSVLIDFHHSDLHESLYRLFQDRLGFTVYTPRGLDWFTEGIWRQGHQHFGDAIAKQFLLAAERDTLQPQREINWVTLDDAKAMEWGLVVASVPDNYDGYARFAQDHGARFAIEVGNVNQWVDRRLDPLILDSTGQYPGGVSFTPEFALEGAFRYREPEQTRLVSSFANLFPRLPCYPLFSETMARLPGWASRVYGHSGPDGFLQPTSAVGERMAACDFIWHDKITGDGFGYVIHYAAAVGRPLIGHASHYRGQRAEFLWEDGVTCIDLDKHSPAETARLMEEIVSDPPRHQAMCEEISRRVFWAIDWDAEAQAISDALGLAVAA